LDATLKKELQKTAVQVRKLAVTAVYSAKSGHPGGSLSIADTLTYLYMHKLNVDPKNPQMPDRDRLVLSKGHCSPALYSVLAIRGFFPEELIKTFRHLGSILQGHPDMKHIPGVDMSTGSLGQGISAACGMAISGKMSGANYKVYAVMGDGELQEGEVWEAAMFAAHNKLDNLVAIVDNNGLQIDGRIYDVMSPAPIDEKFAAFGWHVIKADGHDFDSIEKAFNEAEKIQNQPVVIIQSSVKGKGVSFMENNAGWHGKAPSDAEYAQAIKELDESIA
jgi:transketolase